MADAIHTAGRLLSSEIVLPTLGIKRISQAQPILNAEEHVFKVKTDIRERIESISAGIEEPLSDYHLTTRLPMKIEEALADYHPCARYLTGKIKYLI